MLSIAEFAPKAFLEMSWNMFLLSFARTWFDQGKLQLVRIALKLGLRRRVLSHVIFSLC